MYKLLILRDGSIKNCGYLYNCLLSHHGRVSYIWYVQHLHYLLVVCPTPYIWLQAVLLLALATKLGTVFKCSLKWTKIKSLNSLHSVSLTLGESDWQNKENMLLQRPWHHRQHGQASERLLAYRFSQSALLNYILQDNKISGYSSAINSGEGAN